MNEQLSTPSPTEVASAAARLVAAFGPIEWIDEAAAYPRPRLISSQPAQFPVPSPRRAA